MNANDASMDLRGVHIYGILLGPRSTSGLAVGLIDHRFTPVPGGMSDGWV
jgi:hypothetical protein